MHYYKQSILLLLFLFKLFLFINCENIFELSSHNCNHYHDNLTSLFIQNTISNTNSTNFKFCYLNFKTNSNDNFILKFNLNINLCKNDNNTSNKVNLTITFYYENVNKTINIIDNKNLCGLFNVNNYILLNQTNDFAINLTNSLNVDGLFDIIRSITISKIVYPDSNTGACKTDEFKCNSPPVCVNKAFLSDKFTVCPDNSDQLITTSGQITTKISTLSSNVTSNSTDVNKPINNNTDNSSFGKVKVLVGILITLLIIITIVGIVWIYGRRKRRFREFLAQLDNNTDWEYEQLDDGPPSLAASRATMTPIFSMLSHNENLSRRNISQNNSTNDHDINLMHTLTDTNRNTQNSSINLNNTNTTRNVNERTPITVIS